MIVLIPDAIYTTTDLDRMFRESGINWRTLFDRLKPIKIHDRAYFGGHILSALQDAHAIPSQANRRGFAKYAQAQPLPAPAAPDEKEEGFGLALSNMRRARKMSQEELARRFGCSRKYISDIERGVAHPKMVTRQDLVRALG